MPKRALVVGGAGFIGSHITDLLIRQGHEVYVLDDLSSGKRANVPAPATLIQGDIRDRASVQLAFERARPQWVCHQAAQISVSRSTREPVLDAEINIIGLLHVLEASVGVQAERVVFASSGGVLYGDVTAPAPETAPSRPISPYGISKAAGEGYCQFFARERQLPVVTLRYANVYGPRQDPHGEAGVVAIFTQRLLRGETCAINGDGRYVRDYVYVDDVARANLAAFEADAAVVTGEAFNIGTGLPTDVNQLFAALRDIVNPAAVATYGPPRPGDLRSSVVDARKAAQRLDWRPETSLVEGLRKTVAWFAEHMA